MEPYFRVALHKIVKRKNCALHPRPPSRDSCPCRPASRQVQLQSGHYRITGGKEWFIINGLVRTSTRIRHIGCLQRGLASPQPFTRQFMSELSCTRVNPGFVSRPCLCSLHRDPRGRPSFGIANGAGTRPGIRKLGNTAGIVIDAKTGKTTLRARRGRAALSCFADQDDDPLPGLRGASSAARSGSTRGSSSRPMPPRSRQPSWASATASRSRSSR